MNNRNRVPGWHTAWGLHSNIPECCVDAWVNLGPHNMPPISRWDRWEYRPCQVCLNRGVQTKAKVHICTVKCIPFLEGLHFSKGDIIFLIAWNLKKKRWGVKRKESLRRIYEKRSSNYSTAITI